MVNKSSSSPSSLLDNASLAQLLRECASLVERNEHSALLYKAVEALNLYAESNNGHTRTSAAPNSTMSRPSFQRPTNQKSNLIANGWIELIRRSKFRTIWKEVLASLVEARQPGEETTLWIQRETLNKSVSSGGTNVTGGKGTTTTLEAIHQIPMKWLLDVKLLDFYGDFRFSVKVYNVPEEFVFRTKDEESCRQWVATLISAKESSNSKRATDAAAEVKFPDLLGKESKSGKKSNGTTTSSHSNSMSSSHHSDTSKFDFPDLDMSNGNPKPSAPPMMNHGSTTATTTTNNNNNSSSSSNKRHDGNDQPTQKGHHSVDSTDSSSSARNVNHDKGQDGTAAAAPSKGRMSVKELRAIAHGAGYDTRGMERSDLEKIAAYYAPVSEKTAQYKQQQQQQAQKQQQQAQKQQAHQSRKKEEEAKRQEARKRQEEERRKQTQARMKDEEMKRNQRQQPPPQQQQQQQQNQQNTWQYQSNWNTPPNAFGASSATSSPRRSQPVHNMFESTRFFNYETKSGESGPRRKQPFPSHPQAHQPFPSNTQPSAPPPAPSTASSAPPPPFTHNPQRSTPHPNPPQPHSSSMPQSSNQQRTCDPTSPLNRKYAKAMASNQPAASVQDEQAVITSIKRNILITWALVPPQYNMLRPIDQLLSSIHNVFPPFSNVASHDYFSKWQPINHVDLLLGTAMSGADEGKLKKAVRKLRVFLHPDRLPKEFDSKQSFVCKMLWDVSNDAYEEFLKSKEDLDWTGS